MIGINRIIDIMAESLFPVVSEYHKTFRPYKNMSWDNERFYQWIFLKGLAASLNRDVIADRDLNGKNVDLQILEGNNCIAAIEMKRYYSTSGQREIPNFKSDIQSLRSHVDVPEKIFVITTMLENKARGSKSQEREVFHAPQKAQGRAGSRRVQGFICIRREPARHAEQAVESSASESK